MKMKTKTTLLIVILMVCSLSASQSDSIAISRKSVSVKDMMRIVGVVVEKAEVRLDESAVPRFVFYSTKRDGDTDEIELWRGRAPVNYFELLSVIDNRKATSQSNTEYRILMTCWNDPGMSSVQGATLDLADKTAGDLPIDNERGYLTRSTAVHFLSSVTKPLEDQQEKGVCIWEKIVFVQPAASKETIINQRLVLYLDDE